MKVDQAAGVEKKLQDKNDEDADQVSDQQMECSPRLNSYFQTSWINPASEVPNVGIAASNVAEELSRKEFED